MKPIPDYADLMTLQDFIDCVKSGAINNDDGSGHFANEIQMTDGYCDVDCTYIGSEMSISWCKNMGYTHVAWFNK